MALPALEIQISADTNAAEVGFNKLSRSMDGLEAAANDYQAALNKVNRAEKAGLITSKQAAAAIRGAEDAYKDAARSAAAYSGASVNVTRRTTGLVAAMGRLGRSTGGPAGGIQNVAFQVGDFATQVGAGTSASVALGQQLPQLLGGFGALGAVMGAVVAVGVPLAASFIDFGESAKTADEALDDFVSSMGDAIDAAEIALTPIDDLARKYGEFAEAVQMGSRLAAMANIQEAMEDFGKSTEVVRENIDDLVSAYANYGRAQQNLTALQRMLADEGIYQADALDAARASVDAMKVELDEATGAAGGTLGQWEALSNALSALDAAEGPEAVAIASGQALEAINGMVSASGEIPPALVATVQMLNRINEIASRFSFLWGGGGEGSEPPPPPGGGGGRERPDRIGSLAKSLMTEAEQLEAWREESMQRLADFNALELEALGGHNEAKLRLEEEYLTRLGELQDEERKARLDGIKGALGDAATLMQSENEKLFKIGKAASLANAVVNGYEAATEAWNKGMAAGGPGLAAAFTAASLARTGAMISQIQSQGPRGSGGTGGAAAAAGGATPAAPAPLEARVSGFSPDALFTGQTVSDLLNRLNDEAGDRGLRLLLTQ